MTVVKHDENIMYDFQWDVGEQSLQRIDDHVLHPVGSMFSELRIMQLITSSSESLQMLYWWGLVTG